MAVPEQTPYIEHTGNGITTSFALKFQCESKDHLIVLVDDIEPPIATWSLTGGNVVFTTAPAAGKKITIQRNTPFNRTAEYQSFNNSFRPQTVNVDFDRIWWKLQELGVADWILGARIDALKNYVDDRDDELRAYLMEEIRKQGVALDQLDEYYNYLMQRLAQIAVDKGWDASFVVDGNKNQKQINDDQKRFNERFVFPQDFGAKLDGVTPDDDALEQASAKAKITKSTLVLTGTPFLTRLINIDCNIDGRGAEILTEHNSTHAVFDINGGKGLKIKDLKFKKTRTTIKRGFPIQIRGEAEDIEILNVESDGYRSVVSAVNDFDPTINAKFKFSVSNTATGGSWKIAFATIKTLGQLAWTTSLSHSATASELQVALNILLGVGNTQVIKQVNDYIIEFIGELAGIYITPPYLSYALTGTKSYGGSVEIIQYGGGKFIKNLTLDNVRAKNSGEYGIALGLVDGLKIINCVGKYSFFDGIKFIKHVRNVDIHGGDFCFNGTSWLGVGSSQQTGDGLDAYAGGENVKIFGGRYNFNRGAGLQLKNDDDSDLSGYGMGKYGLCRNFEINGIEASFNSVSAGLCITTNKSGVNDYSVTGVTVNGGVFEGNATAGVLAVCGQNIVLNSVKTKRNGYYGIWIGEFAKHVSVNQCSAIANARRGLLIQGKEVTINEGIYDGADTDNLTFNTDTSALIKHHTSNIQVDATAENVLINMPYEANNSSSRGILVNGSPKNVVIHQKPTETLTANSSLIYGDIGSTFINKSGVKFTKVTGTVSTGIWRSRDIKQVVNINEDTTINGAADLHIVRAQNSNVAITLPLAQTMVGLSTSFVLYTSTIYKAQIMSQGADTINGGSVSSIELSSIGECCELTATSIGWLITNKLK